MLVRGLIVLVLFSVATAFAAPVPKSLKKLSKVDTARFKLNYEKAPFDRVFEDFAEGTGLEWVGERPHLGTITLKPRQEYNTAEFIDLLNEVLERENFCIIRHAGTFFLHPADQPVDVAKVDTVTVEDIKLLREPVKRRVPGWGGGEEQWVGGKWVPVEQTAAEERPRPKRGTTELATLVIEQSTIVRFEDVRPLSYKVVESIREGGCG